MSAVSLASVCQYRSICQPGDSGRGVAAAPGQEYRPTPVHDFLVKFAQYEPPSDYPANRPYPCIVTACFDQVLEQQLRKNEVPFHLVAFVLGPSGGVFTTRLPGGA
jgi:hypothetical protein